MPEKRKRRELRKFPAALTRRLAAEGFRIERRYVNLPTIAEVFQAVERAEPIWVYQCWTIVRKTRQRARKARAAPNEKGRGDSPRQEGGGLKNLGGREPYFC
jgi:hypothetical protein